MARRALYNDGISKRRLPVDEELDITPMIDVTFLLLIFFMVSSTMQQEAKLQIPPAKHGEGVAMDTAIILTIATRDGEPQIYLGDGIKESPSTLGEIPPYVESQVKSGKSTLVIKADRELPSGYVEEVARTANEVEGIDKYYVGIQDKPE